MRVGLPSPYLPLELSPDEIAAMLAIKQAWDPHGIMNPGKVFGTLSTSRDG